MKPTSVPYYLKQLRDRFRGDLISLDLLDNIEDEFHTLQFTALATSIVASKDFTREEMQLARAHFIPTYCEMNDILRPINTRRIAPTQNKRARLLIQLLTTALGVKADEFANMDATSRKAAMRNATMFLYRAVNRTRSVQ